MFGDVGEDTRLEVAAQSTLHADARSRQVRGANVDCFQVEKHHLDILDVGSANPQRLADFRYPRNDLGIMLLVLDVLGEYGHGSKDNLALVFCHSFFVYLISVVAVNPADSAFVPGG